ncbi:hypothetical protein VTN49DRAFT_1883 [Thermomyces lanuginosus]|uniref:uncharacterized protein n=1 Tax=Thermomyces lanuginosus TaxID=5541 RepID=UPI003744217C
MDEHRYRTEVLHLHEDETEDSVEERLFATAANLGLKIPDAELAASSAASINSASLGSTILSSHVTTSSLRASMASSSLSDVERSGAASVDQLASSFSNTTISEYVPSTYSWSPRPMSIASVDDRSGSIRVKDRPQATGSPTERKRHSLLGAIGKSLRKRRPASMMTLSSSSSPRAVVPNRQGPVDKFVVETRNEGSHLPQLSEVDQPPAAEAPVYDDAAMQRSLHNPELIKLLEKHKAERDRLVALRENLMELSKTRHREIISERKIQNERIERQREEQNAAILARMEERQLQMEMDMMDEFRRAKQNSETRIKYMQRYVDGATLPDSPTMGSQSSFSSGQSQPARHVTRQQWQQLEQELRDLDSMDRVHQARIKVLRERQERQLQNTTAKLERELQDLVNRNIDAIAELERQHLREQQAITQAFEAKKARLRRRWNLEEAILRKRLEERDGKPYGPLPEVSFDIDPIVERSRSMRQRSFLDDAS